MYYAICRCIASNHRRGTSDGGTRARGDIPSCIHRTEESKSLLRKTLPAARRVFGENDSLTIRMRANYAAALYYDNDAILDDLHEAVTTLVETVQTARQVLGGAHPTTKSIERSLQRARAVLRARA